VATYATQDAIRRVLFFFQSFGAFLLSKAPWRNSGGLRSLLSVWQVSERAEEDK